MAAGGGLLRDKFGNWILGFTRKIGTNDSFSVELWALLRDGLTLAIQYHFSHIIIETGFLYSFSIAS